MNQIKVELRLFLYGKAVAQALTRKIQSIQQADYSYIYRSWISWRRFRHGSSYPIYSG